MVLFFPHLHTKLAKRFEIWYVYLERFQPYWNPSQPRNVGFLSVHIFSLKTEMLYSDWYRQKSLQFDQSTQFGGRLDVFECKWPWVEIQSCPNLGEGMLRSQKCKNCSFLSQLIEKLMLYNISKHQPRKSTRRGDKRGFPPFWPWKKTVSPQSSYPIAVGT